MGLAILIISGLLLAQSNNNHVAWLHGRVLDMHGAAIPGISLSVSALGKEFTAISDIEGRFSYELPAGSYSLVATGASILPYRRAILTLPVEQHKYVVIRPIFQAPSDQEGISDPEIKYKVQSLPNGAEAMIRFDSSTIERDKIVFRGRHLMLTSGFMAVYGRELSCSNPIRVCTATDIVSAEVENEQMEGESVVVDLIDRRLVLTRSPTVMRSF